VAHIKHVSCELDYCNGSGDSNFLDLDWLSTLDNERFGLFILMLSLFYIFCASEISTRHCNEKMRETVMSIYR
jgi:hypothetical protein